LNLSTPYVRNLDNKKRFDDLYGPADPIWRAGEAWEGAFWEMRKSIGRAASEVLLFGAWCQLKPEDAAASDAEFTPEGLFKKRGNLSGRKMLMPSSIFCSRVASS